MLFLIFMKSKHGSFSFDVNILGVISIDNYAVCTCRGVGFTTVPVCDAAGIRRRVIRD
jgi:hypothetical protein